MSSTLNAAQIHSLIQGLPSNHILKSSLEPYVGEFIEAALQVYPASRLQKILQEKFLIPDASNYSDGKYFQSASELSVARYLKQKEKEKVIRDLVLEKPVNPKNETNVDNFFRVKAKSVSVEVKCPQKEKQAPFPTNITVKTAGRIPDPDRSYNFFKETIESGSSGANVLKGKRGAKRDRSDKRESERRREWNWGSRMQEV